MSTYFINARMTVGPVGPNALNISGDPDQAWVCTVAIDRAQPKKEYQQFFGKDAEDATSKAEFFVNALGNARVLKKLEDVLTNESVIDVNQLLTLIKTAHRWN